MKIKTLLSISAMSVLGLAQAQNSELAYAITGTKANLHSWSDIKQIDLKTGKVIKTVFDAAVKKEGILTLEGKSSAINAQDLQPTAWGVAAAALDERHNRLYFSPLHISEIRYMDLSDGSFHVIKSDVIESAKGMYQSEENHLTRMVIAADGNGYALSNNGQHLIRFSTSRKIAVEDLGALVDAESNKGISIHNKCTSWGGDMVADAFGKLVVISANRNVFDIDLNTKVATFQGTITGLPATYTTNGAAVNKEGKIIVSNAVAEEAMYIVDPKTWVATKVENSEANFNAADLATTYQLNQTEYNARKKFLNEVLPKVADVISGNAKVFPNPVTNSEFKIYFDGQANGVYRVLVTDLNGKVVLSKNTIIGFKNQVESVGLNKGLAKGMYLVKVIDSNNKQVITERIVVQ